MDVLHLPDQSTFQVITTHGASTLRYRLSGQSIDFYTTFVQPGDRGTRVGISLVKAAVTWAQDQALQMSASCWYVDKYLVKHSLA